MKELTLEGGWGGGSFNFNKDEVIGKEIEIQTCFGSKICTGFITDCIKRFGTDYDHGHEYRWENVDYLYELPDDPFERWTKLTTLLGDNYKVFLKD